MFGLNCKLGCTKYLRNIISSKLVEPRMYSAIATNLNINKLYQFHKTVISPKIPFWDFKRDCPLRLLSISGSNIQTVTSLDVEPSDDNVLESIPGGKIFRENEAEFHHKIMEDCSSYSSTIFKHDAQFTAKYQLNDVEFCDLVESKNWENKSATTLAETFVSLGVYSNSVSHMTLEDERLDHFIGAFLQKCSLFSDDELMDCLVALQQWAQSSKSVREEQFLKVWKALDQVCHERYIDWSHDKILYVVDLWYQVKLARLSIFVYKALKKISNKCEK